MTSRDEILNKPSVFSWSARVDFIVNSCGGFQDYDGSPASLLWDQDLILRLEGRKIHSDLSAAGSRGFRLTVEAADTASDAEKLGTRVALAILAVALNSNWGLSLAWPDSPLPCRVMDRTRGLSLGGSGNVSISRKVKVAQFVRDIERQFDAHADAPYRVLLSMELCAASRIETSSRSRLVMLVSAFEALAEQQKLGGSIGDLITKLRAVVADHHIEDPSMRDSLLGQIDNLSRESANRAIKRMLKELDLDDADRDLVARAYAARSMIVHAGHRVPELESLAHDLDRLLVRVHGRIARRKSTDV